MTWDGNKQIFSLINLTQNVIIQVSIGVCVPASVFKCFVQVQKDQNSLMGVMPAIHYINKQYQ